MDEQLVIRSQTDTAARDEALVRLRSVMTESAQIIVDGIALRRAHAELILKSHTGLESGHILDYPVAWTNLTSALGGDDEDAAVRSEVCAAILEWMREGRVPSSHGFEDFFRWAVFEDLLLDGDHLAVLDAAGAPLELPVGWRCKVEEGGETRYVVRTESRPHLAQVHKRTWMVMRADGWSTLLYDQPGWIGDGSGQVKPPDFATVRSTEHEDAVWFRNDEVVAEELIDFSRAFYAFSDRT